MRISEIPAMAPAMNVAMKGSSANKSSECVIMEKSENLYVFFPASTWRLETRISTSAGKGK